MTAAPNLLAFAASRGVRLRIQESGKLEVCGPLDGELRDQLRAHRDELLAYVATVPQTAPCGHCGKFAFPITERLVIGFWCRRRMGTTPGAENSNEANSGV